jgi:ferredoxin
MTEVKVARASTRNVEIFIAGDMNVAKQICREFCFSVGACVTIEPTDYIYRGGEEAGVRVGFINYPRFPKEEEKIMELAKKLGNALMDGLFQHSFSIVGQTETIWYSRRPENHR